MISVYHFSKSDADIQNVVECLEMRTRAAGLPAAQLTPRTHEQRFDPDLFDDERAVHIAYRSGDEISVYARLYPTYLLGSPPARSEQTSGDDAHLSNAFELQKLTISPFGAYAQVKGQVSVQMCGNALGRAVRAVLAKALRFAAINDNRAVAVTFTSQETNLARKIGLDHTLVRRSDGSVLAIIPSSTANLSLLQGLKLVASNEVPTVPPAGLVRLSSPRQSISY